MTLHSCYVADFESWRNKARYFLERETPPADIHFHDGHHVSLFDHTQEYTPQTTIKPDTPTHPVKPILIPAGFMSLAKIVACHADTEKWALLYACLWRLTHGEKNLLHITTDPLMRTLRLYAKAVTRDAHKTKAFVRFREYTHADGTSYYVAWHKPDHNVLPLVADFFQRRFHIMQWTIMTPYCTAHWNGHTLQFSDGVPAYEHPTEDNMEDVWLAYYRSTFNPARIKLNMMRQEMPTRY